MIATVIVATVAVAGASHAIWGSGSGSSNGFTANLYLSASAANDCTGGRSATRIDYATAVAQNRVCQKWTTACSAATGGDKVGVKAGQYTSEIPAQSTLALFETDCSDGLAADVDPTQLAAGTQPSDVTTVANNWVRFTCADGEVPTSTTGPSSSTVYDDFGDFTPHGNNHIWIQGGCFFFSDVLFGRGSDTTVTTSNVILDGVQIQAFELKGAKNIWVNNSELGPFVYCGNSSVTVDKRCVSSGSPIGWYEERWAGRGDIDKNGQGQIGPNSGVDAENILFSNIWMHDNQTKDPAPSGWHTGCLNMQDNSGGSTTTPSDNVIIRNFKCERVAVQGILLAVFDGITVENSQFACPTYAVANDSNNPTNLWAKPACGQAGIIIQTGGPNTRDNILIRYNSVVSTINGADNASIGVNVRVIGNIADNFSCPTDVTGDYNVRITGSSCGTNGSVSASPWVDSDPGTSFSNSTLMDMHLSGSAGSFAWENGVSPTASDYALTVDMDNATRTSGSRDPGADER